MTYTLAQWLEHLANKQPDTFNGSHIGNAELILGSVSGKKLLLDYSVDEQCVTSDDCAGIEREVVGG